MSSTSSSQSAPKYINDEVLDALVCLIDDEARVSRIDPYTAPACGATGAIASLNYFVGCRLKQFARWALQYSPEPRTITTDHVRNFIRAMNQQTGMQG